MTAHADQIAGFLLAEPALLAGDGDAMLNAIVSRFPGVSYGAVGRALKLVDQDAAGHHPGPGRPEPDDEDDILRRGLELGGKLFEALGQSGERDARVIGTAISAALGCWIYGLSEAAQKQELIQHWSSTLFPSDEAVSGHG